MTAGMGSIDLIIGVTGLTVCILGFAPVITARSMQKRTRRYFVIVPVGAHRD